MATAKYTYEQDADSLYALVTDPEMVRERSIAMGERDIQLTKDGETLTNVRTVDADVPGFAAKVLRPTSTVREVKRWNALAKTGELTVEMQGAPARLEGTLRIVPNGSGCDYIIDYAAKVRVPLIGGKIAAFIENATKKSLDEEFAWNSKKLASR